jgi:hypothetical protein
LNYFAIPRNTAQDAVPQIPPVGALNCTFFAQIHQLQTLNIS